MADYSQLTLHGDSEVTRPEFQVEPGPDSTHTPFPGAATTPSGTRTFPRPGQDSEVERLQEQVRALQIRAGRAEQTLQDERRRRSRALEARQSTGSSEFGLTTYARPKLATPWTFKGSYSELLNVLNWINTVTRYLDQCRADPEDWSGISRTYTPLPYSPCVEMDSTVLARLCGGSLGFSGIKQESYWCWDCY